VGRPGLVPPGRAARRPGEQVCAALHPDAHLITTREGWREGGREGEDHRGEIGRIKTDSAEEGEMGKGEFHLNETPVLLQSVQSAVR